MKLFVGGSRRITRLSAEVREYLETAIDRGVTFMVGDANGADKTVQMFLKVREYEDVEIYHTVGTCRNNLGMWPTCAVQPRRKRRDFEYFAAKDRAMAEEAEEALMLWDGKSRGTLLNVYRMVHASKPVTFYNRPYRRIERLERQSDWVRILNECDAALKETLLDLVGRESDLADESAQGSLW